MIGKVMHNSSFRATTRYVLEKEGASMIGGSVAGDSVKELVGEFMWSKDLNPSLKHPVWHMSLSLPHDEHLDDRRFSELASNYLAGMVLLADDHTLINQPEQFRQKCDEFVTGGLSEYQYFVARHSDQEHDHVHIVASRINLTTGNGVPLWRDKTRNQKVLRYLETEYGLTPVANSWEVGKKSATKGQLEKQAQTGEVAIQAKLQGLIEQAAIDHPQMPVLFERLMRQGVEVRHGWTRTGKSKGISYSLEGVAFAGNQLGQRYSFPGLQKHLGVSYDADRDDEKLRLLMTDGVGQEDSSLIDQQQQQLAQALSRSALRIVQQAGHQDDEGRWVYSHPKGNYTIVYSPEKDGLVVSSREKDGVILVTKGESFSVQNCRVTEQDLTRFQQFEQMIARSPTTQRQQQHKSQGREID